MVVGLCRVCIASVGGWIQVQWLPVGRGLQEWWQYLYLELLEMITLAVDAQMSNQWEQ